mgnify:CR=1 FL=1
MNYHATCPACGGDEIWEARYVRVSTGEVLGELCTPQWCGDCEEPVEAVLNAGETQ